MMRSIKTISAKKSCAAATKVLQDSSVHVMSAAELHQDMHAFAAQLAGDPQAATTFLQNAGILASNGKLAKAYR
ncbi:hypothetical protein D9O50_07295 [Oxalobacteraceae bacterium CAVE-383]|nr:hypothetical protein D9O50_07295 [Oxalobacteraceae bacterium CAVE-383]